MSSSFRGVAALVAVSIAALIGVSAPASATTFCVPNYHAACPDNGTNVPQPDLEVAMGSNANDDVADRIFIAAHTYTGPDSLQPEGSDPLEVIGSGTDQTFLTSSSSGNIFVVNLAWASRTIDMRDLTIVLPDSLPNGLGAALQVDNSTLERVDVEVRNPGSDVAPSVVGELTWTDSRFYATGSGSIDTGLRTNPVGSPGPIELAGLSIESPNTGIVAEGQGAPVTLRQSRITDPGFLAVRVSDGGVFDMENSVIETGGEQGILAYAENSPGETDVLVDVKNSTFVNDQPTGDPAVQVEIEGSVGSRNADVTVSESIFRGFDETWEMITPAGPGIGSGSLTITDSNFTPNGTPSDSPVVDISDPGNIDQDPLFVGATDFRLQEGSPSIDAGDPAAGTLVDFDGTVRPLDGDGDGVRIRDMGAFEAAEIPTCATDESLCPPPTCETDPSLCPVQDTVAPKVSKVKFRHGKARKKGGTLKLNLSEAATVRATFKPVPAKKKGKQTRKTVKLTKKGKAGANTLVIRKRKLKAGKYRLTVIATDAAGNRSKPLIRKIKVRG